MISTKYKNMIINNIKKDEKVSMKNMTKSIMKTK